MIPEYAKFVQHDGRTIYQVPEIEERYCGGCCFFDPTLHVREHVASSCLRYKEELGTDVCQPEKTIFVLDLAEYQVLRVTRSLTTGETP